MKLVRSDSPEVADSIASSGALASWSWSVLILVYIASAPGLLIVLIASLIVWVRSAVWLGVPAVLALIGYLFRRARSPRLNWVVAGSTDRVFVRPFVQRRRGRTDIQEPNVIMLEASEIASMRVRVVEVFLYGPKPRFVEWLVIEPPQAIAEGFSDRIRSLLKSDGPGKQGYVTNEEGRLAVNWKFCRPDLRTFLQQVERECPSVIIGREERSELDLNGIWRGISLALDREKRQLLVRAMRLGFDCECKCLFSRYKYISFQKAAAYLAGIEREEGEQDTPQRALGVDSETRVHL